MKRALYIFTLATACLCMVLFLIVSLLRSSEVQTAIVRLVTQELSKQLKTKFSISDIDYHFPATVSVHDIYLEDFARDTLIYIEEVAVHFRPHTLKNDIVTFEKITLRHAKTYLHELADGTKNYAFLLPLFAREQPTSFNWNLPVAFQANSIELDDITVATDDFEGRVDNLSLQLKNFNNKNIHFILASVEGSVTKDETTFRLEDGYVHMMANDSTITIPQLLLKTPNSKCYLSDVFLGCNVAQIIDWVQEIKTDTGALRKLAERPFSLDLTEMTVQPQDFALFAPMLDKVNAPLSARFFCMGTLNDLFFHSIDVTLFDENLLHGNIRLNNLLSWKEADVNAMIDNLGISFNRLQDVISMVQQRPFHFPHPVMQLGYVQVKGNATGNAENINFAGLVKTQLGNVSTDVKVQSKDLFQSAKVKAKVATKNFKLRRMLPKAQLGRVTAAVNIDCSVSADKEIDGRVEVTVPSFEFRQYNYKNLHLTGELLPKNFDVTISSKDENAAFASSLALDIRDSLPKMKYQMTVDNFNPYTLHLTDLLEGTSCRIANLQAELVGSNPDNINGMFSIDTMQFKKMDDTVTMNKLELKMLSEDEYKNFKVMSDFFTCKIEGRFDFKNLPNTMQAFAIHYLPNLFSDKRIAAVLNKPKADYIDFYLYAYNINKVQEMLGTPIKIGDYSVIKGYLNGNKNLWGIQCLIPSLQVKNIVLNDITLSTDNADDVGKLSLSSQWKNTDYLIKVDVANNDINTSIISTKENRRTAFVSFSTSVVTEKSKPRFNIHFSPSEFLFLDTIVNISESEIFYSVLQQKLGVHDFNIKMADQQISVDGICSKSEQDSISVVMENVSVRELMAFGVPKEKFSVGGYISGKVKAFSVFALPLFEADVELDSAHLNESHIGTAYATAHFNKEDKTISLEGDVFNKERHTAYVTGLFEPLRKKWGIEIEADSVNIGFINHWTNGIIEDIDGAVFGNVRVFGQSGNTWVLAKAKTHDAALTIPYTGCRYTLNDSVFMDSTSIRFPFTTMRDQEGNPLYLEGMMEHVNFRDFRFNIVGKTENTLSLNIPDTEGELIQGKVYSSGDVSVMGDMSKVVVDANVRTVGNSRFRMSVNTPSNASTNNFITFVDNTNVYKREPLQNSQKDEDTVKATPVVPKTTFLLNLNIEAEPTMLFQLVINERTEDIIEGRGRGTVRFSMENDADKMQMLGTYTLESGTFHFTVGNVIKRGFEIGEGSTVRWNGVPQQPELDIVAKYSVTASLKDLFGEEISAISKSRTSIPVNACVSLRGTLNDPLMYYSIELPQAEDVVKDQVKSVINTDEMVTKQVIYLLVFGKFFTPDYLKNADNFSVNETYSLMSSTISGQINAWLSKLTKVFSMGVNIRNPNEENSEYEAQFQLQPIDQLVINGNIGYRYNDFANRPLFGDIDVEYKIIPSGKVRLKAYSHSVDQYSIQQAATTQGVGFIFKHDFNWRKKKKNR